MPAPDFVIRQGDTASPLIDTLTDAAGDPVDLTLATVALTVTPAAGGAPIVDQAAATNLQTGPSTNVGKVSYQWREADTNTPGDTDTPGFYLAAWTVTFQGGDVQSFPNEGYVLVSITPTAPDTVTAYVSAAELKATLEIPSAMADADVAMAIAAACRTIDDYTDRRFLLGAAGEVRRFTPTRPRVLEIDDAVTVTTVEVDRGGDGAYETTWSVGTQLVADPANATADGRPFERLVIRRTAGVCWPVGLEQSVRVTGRFGWQTVPGSVRQAATILAGRYLKRAREAPFGIVSVSLDTGAAARLTRTDPDVADMLEPFNRRPKLA